MQLVQARCKTALTIQDTKDFRNEGNAASNKDMGLSTELNP